MTVDFVTLLAYVRANPFVALSCAVGFVVVVYLLQRKPAIQRRADERLSILRKENAGRYDRLRPLE